LLQRASAYNNTADHGQLLGEHNTILHGIHLYDELLGVPLIIHYPISIDVEVTKMNGVISTTRIHDLATGIVTGKVRSDEILYSDIVFSESWGIHHDIEHLMQRRIKDERLASLLRKLEDAIDDAKARKIVNIFLYISARASLKKRLSRVHKMRRIEHTDLGTQDVR